MLMSLPRCVSAYSLVECLDHAMCDLHY